jgi:ABC-type antimicrobial peptide transport system permease subunit
MFKNYLKIAFRNIVRNKLFAGINIFGLAVGMACFILIFLWVQHQLSYDKFHLNKDELYLINIKQPDDLSGYGDPNAPYALAPVLAGEFPEISDYTRIVELSNQRMCSFKYRPMDRPGEQKIFYEEDVWLVDTSFFSMFSFPFSHGDPKTALENSNSIVITDKISKKYFGEKNPLGKKLTLNNQVDYIVTGVVHVPANSHLQFNLIAPVRDKMLTNWNWADPAFILTHKNISVRELRRKIAGSLNKHYPNQLPGIFKVDILPISKLHLYFGRRAQVYIFSIIAVFILLIACINYMNLTTASSVKRAKEVGIRKVVGAKRIQLIKQFLGESILLSAFALILALLLAQIFLPLLDHLTSKHLVLFPLANQLYFVCAGLVFIVGMISGSYPALFLTAYKPVRILRAARNFKSRRSLFRVVSVVGQFAISILLIAGTIIVFKQLNYIQSRPLGFKTDYVISIPLNNGLRKGFDSFKNELLRNPNILNATAGQAFPFDEDYKTQGVEWKDKDPKLVPMIRYSIGRFDYIETFGMEMADGRSFSKKFPTDKDNYIINEEAVKYMGMKSPLDRQIAFWGNVGRIIGVVKDFHHVSLHRKIMPQIFTANPEYFKFLKFVFVKIKSVNVPDTLNHIKAVNAKFAPAFPFKFDFLDEEMGKLYTSEQKLGKIFSYFAFVAILISCLGIFGLAAFTAERRIKEIGIRKTFGASVSSIVVLLTKGFTRWVLLASIVALPIAWYAMQRWLQDFAYRTSIGPWIFILSGAAAMIIALLTVSYQAVRSATANPVEALRYE